ncbi:2-C-methyl-D-erythritol 4-phosphate cytidylyltransferase [Alkalilimnicola ehrlichii]|uniref:2-C-methyl-D-erythritol 4-phosphate cytidylyltransferase n=1 Tax=Alkalilimnicola ehrlichii TaxID=351052 RepID=A0A3E0WRT8_9GAMM|nr:2-C-methyl-D-erythritol 4-phosphate cytidylyltransferase [Alkalilimnicola ehrlichii]RFA28260.1 2-C-methyl-D-erythritol 4-phosphate cytidylyltransferase [Alkalilimnicola ehrlichii]RFA34861.1 2-C-methyl-D-erythritol 4-phosphate cytidylyltransferase [Alkalilimnicola ehrlichii]
MSSVAVPRIWAVLPAAGVGRRMGAELPKQYLPLLGEPVICRTLSCLLGHSAVYGGVIALAEDDLHWATLQYQNVKPLHRVTGGAERRDSVMSALRFLLAEADDSDWVMVHDAVRPCVTERELDRLVARATAHAAGGLLAMPVRDTLKREGSQGTVAATTDREGLWHALTPQLFPLRLLYEALLAVIDADTPVTDESQAMELRGHRPLLIEGSATNLKITRPSDLTLAEVILKSYSLSESDTCV